MSVVCERASSDISGLTPLSLLLQQRELVPPTPLVSLQVLKEEKDCWEDMQASLSCKYHLYIIFWASVWMS